MSVAPDRGARDAALERALLDALPDVMRFARALARDPTDADDLVQETYLAAWRGSRTFRPGHDARRWLLAICHHAFLRQRERAGRVVVTDDGTEAELEALATAREHGAALRDGLEARLATIDLAPAIARALDALPEVYRSAVVLVDVQDASYEEAAAILRVPVGTVRSRLFRARRLLQAALVEHARDAGFRSTPPLPPGPIAGRDETT